MARIDYGRITDGIREVISNTQYVIDTQATVGCGQPAPVLAAMTPHVGVYEQARTPTPGQTLAAFTRMRYTLNWVIWVAVVSGAGYLDAVNQRDELLGHIEIAMMCNRSVNGLLPNGALNLGGGDLRSGPGGNGGFIAEGSLNLWAEVEATTT